MTFLTGLFNQTITHWSFAGVDSAGDPSFSAPTTLTGKWDEKNELLIGSNGEEFNSTAMVFLPSDIKVEDYLFLGTSVIVDPKAVRNAFVVKSFRKIPTIDAKDFERKAFL